MEWAASATYTVMFTDLVDSTALRTRVGDDTADALQREHHDLVRRLVDTHGGALVKTMGDGTMTAFLGAADGLACAVAIQQSMHERNRHTTDALEIRVGLSLGDGRYEDGDLNGTPVVEAARLCAAAGAGEILSSAVVRIVAGSRATHRFTDLGPLSLKGLGEPLPTVRVEWEPFEPGEADGPPFPPALAVGARIPFIGRHDELERMVRCWHQATEGRRAVVLVSGEPGIGKTRLAGELARHAHAHGATVLYGRCDDELGVPYQPFVEALAFVVEQYDPEQFTAALGRHASELTRLVPGLAEHIAGLGQPATTDPETAQYRLFDAVTGALRAGADARPVLLVLDDLQWAAKPTLLLLRHVAATVDPARLMIVGTSRDTDLSRSRPLSGALADLRRLDGVEQISLTGLAAPEVVELLARIAGHELDDTGLALARMIYSETDGHPLFTGEVLRHLRDVGAIVEVDGRWTTHGEVTSIGIPDGVRAVIGRRLDRLSPAANAMLQPAAVIGLTFELAVLEAVVELPSADLLGALDETVDARILYETAAGQYAFSHALVRATLYDELRPTRRAHLHEAVADAIGHVHAQQLDAHLGELAYHYSRGVGAGNADRAADFARRAGARALEQLALDDAVAWFEQARELIELGGADPRALGRVLVGLGTAQKHTGGPTYRETLLRAAAVAREAGDDAVLVDAALANNRWFWSNYGVVDDDRVETLRAAIATTPPTGSPARAHLLANLASELVFGEDLAARRVLIDEALTIARATDDSGLLAHVLISRFVALWHPSTLGERLGHAAELAGIVEVLGDPSLAYFNSWYQFAALVEAGRLVEADRVLERCGELATVLPQALPGWSHAFTRSGRAHLRGDLALAETLALEQLDIGSRAGQPDAPLYYGILLYAIRLEQGRIDEMADLIAAVGSGPDALDGIDPLWGVTAALLGRDDEARAVLDRLARDDFTGLPEHQAWAPICWAAAVIAVQLGDLARAALLYDLLLPYDGQLVYPGLVVFDSVGGTLGMLATALGREEAAAKHLAHAERLAEAIDAPLLLARTRARQRGDLRLLPT